MTKKTLVISLSFIAFTAFFIIGTIYPQGFMSGGSLSYVLTFALLYILLLWGISMYYRIQYNYQKKIILSIVIILIIWTITKYLKWLPNIHYLSIYLDYAYYIPMVSIPILFSSLCIESFYKHAKWKKAYYIFSSTIASLFVLLVFTNDLHHLIYDYIIIKDEMNPLVGHFTYDYGPAHYVCMIFIGLSTIFTFTLFAIGVRKKVSLWQILIPLFIYALLLLYSILYLLKVPLIRNTVLIKDFATSVTIILLMLLEALLDVGLIRNNGLYLSNFKKSAIPMCIFDNERNILFKSNTFNSTKRDDENYRYNVKTEDYYEIVVEESMEKIIELKETIKRENENIEKINTLLEKTININAKNQSILNKTKLVNEIENNINETEIRVKKIIDSIPDDINEANKEEIMKRLGTISLLLGYMKQKCMLLIEFKKNNEMTFESFSFLLDVIKNDISTAGYLDVAFNVVSSKKSNVYYKEIIIINDFINQVAYEYSNTSSNMFVIINLDNKKVTIDIDGKNLKNCRLKMDDVSINSSKDETLRISMGW